MLTLTSDFGTPYPAAMRGVLYEMTDDATVVDIAHDLPRQDVRSGAFWLREVLPWFPPAVHCAVVDPGVGSERDALIVKAGDHALVGPDNGLLAPVARALDSDPTWYRLSETNPASSTFHGRDVFAPTAARVYEAGVDAIDQLDGITDAMDPIDLTFPEPTIQGNQARGEVLVVDGFGNIVTNVPGGFLDTGADSYRVNGEEVPVGYAYAAVEPGAELITIGSHGNVELAVNHGRADTTFGLSVGDSVLLE
jgi:S-adenosylmethionine hydrolase